MNNGLLSPKWTDEQVAYALKTAGARPSGQSRASVAAEIGAHIGRTGKSVEQKLIQLTLTPETRARRSKLERARYAKRVENCNPYRIEIFRPTQQMIDARDARSAAKARDLTAALCGDPPVGYSALERRA